MSVELEREDAGRFEGVASLPPGTVYAMAAVEDKRGGRIDTNRGRFWEYIERDRKGRPTVRARLYQLLATEEFSPSRIGEVGGAGCCGIPGAGGLLDPTPRVSARHGSQRLRSYPPTDSTGPSPTYSTSLRGTAIQGRARFML